MWPIKLLWISSMFSLVALIAYSLTTLDFTYLIISIFYYYIISILGNTICYHRYLSHRTFETDSFRKSILLIANFLTGQGSIFYAVSMHRHHHKHSDTDLDVHSSHDSYFNNFFFYLRSFDFFTKEKKVRPAFDLMRDKQIMFLHNYYVILWIITITVLLTLSWKFAVFVLLSSVGLITLHTNFVRTFLSHNNNMSSYRNFETDDRSVNNTMQFLSLGEALHNNHHANPSTGNQAINQKEFDPVWMFIEKFLKVDHK